MTVGEALRKPAPFYVVLLVSITLLLSGFALGQLVNLTVTRPYSLDIVFRDFEVRVESVDFRYNGSTNRWDVAEVTVRNVGATGVRAVIEVALHRMDLASGTTLIVARGSMTTYVLGPGIPVLYLVRLVWEPFFTLRDVTGGLVTLSPEVGPQ